MEIRKVYRPKWDDSDPTFRRHTRRNPRMDRRQDLWRLKHGTLQKNSTMNFIYRLYIYDWVCSV